MFLSEALEVFVSFAQVKHAASTVSIYRGLIEKFIRWHGDADLADLTDLHVNAWCQHLRRGNYCSSTVAYAMIAMRQFCKLLFLRKMIAWDYELIQVPKYANTSYSPVRKTEVDAMISSLRLERFRELRDATILSFLTASGVRISELCKLTIDDVKPGKQYTVIISAKNQVKRVVLWDKRTQELLKLYLRHREPRAHSDALWIATDPCHGGEGISPRSVQRMFARYRTSKDQKPHGIRHGFGVDGLEKGVNVRTLQTLLGHKHIQSTQVYMQVTDHFVKKEYKKMRS